MEIVLWPRDAKTSSASRVSLIVDETHPPDDNWACSSLHVRCDAANAAFDADFSIETVNVPSFLVSAQPIDGALLRALLRPDDALRTLEAQARESAQDKLDHLRMALANIPSSTAAGGQAEFLGVRRIAGVAIAYTVRVELDRLFDDASTEVLVRIEADAALAAFASFANGSAQVAGRARLTLAIDATFTPLLGALFDAPSLPELKVEWPKRLCRVKNNALDLLATFADDAADLAGAFAHLLDHTPVRSFVSVKVRTKPDFAITVVDGDLGIATTKGGAIDLVLKDCQGADSGSLLGTVDDVTLTLSGDRFTLAGKASAAANAPRVEIDRVTLPDEVSGPYAVTLEDVVVNASIQVATGAPALVIVVTPTVGRLEVRARTDPSLVLAFAIKLKLTLTDGAPELDLVSFSLIEPSTQAVAASVAKVIAADGHALWSLIQSVDLAAGEASSAAIAILQRVADLLVAGATWAQQEASSAMRVLSGLAESALQMLGKVLSAVVYAVDGAGQALYRNVTIELRVDLARRRLIRIVVVPAGFTGTGGDPVIRASVLGVDLTLSAATTPSLICDLEEGWTALALVSQNATKLTLSTDLWLDNDEAANERVTSEAADPATNPAPDAPLVEVTATLGGPANVTAFALVVLQQGRARFFVPFISPTPSAQLLQSLLDVDPSSAAPDLKFDASLNSERVLSLFRLPSSSGSGTGWLQSIKVKKSTPPSVHGTNLDMTVDVEIDMPLRTDGNTALATTLKLSIDLRDLSARLSGGRVGVAMTGSKRLTMLGLTADIDSLDKKPTTTYTPFYLDLSGGNPSFAFDPKQATLKLHYDQLSSGGRPLGFDVAAFVIANDGIDLDASVAPDPVVLAGVDVPFRFTNGRLSVKRGRIQAFSLSGNGNLPPALVGEAKASIVLSFAQSGGRLALQACEAVLDKGKDPLRCDSTRFTLTIEKLGLKVVEQSGYHFYFTLTGSAEFRPGGGEFADGLLKNLSKVRIVLDEAPLAGDPRVLLQHIEFLVPIDPPASINFFNVFNFQLRGVGFHPSSPAFDGAPALCLSGQLEFTDTFDVVTPRIDFHKLWIAPPAQGQVLPRIRFDGLGVGLSLGPNILIYGMGRAIDGSLPTIEGADLPKSPVTGKGFLAEGSVRIKGFASLSATMGFLELQKGDNPEKRLAFFLYMQLEDISIPIETPIGDLFIRTVGFGFGYRFTLAGLAAADQAQTPRQLVALLDSISKYQGDLDKISAWSPTYDNDAATFAVRILVSIASSSTDVQTTYDKEEDDYPNLVLFDVVAALRTDLTFLMNVRLWVAFNYADWRKAKAAGGKPWQENPSLTGYMYLSAPNHEFLARAVYNPGAEIGDHPIVYPALKDAMKAAHWSSTLYIRPGLFHQEFGWPYELGFDVGHPSDSFYLSVRGGTVMRYEDAALLYGLAFQATGAVSFSASTGGSFGASVSARADFALGAKLIAYIALDSNQSMLYGTLSLDICVSFSVHMWLNARFFSLSASFSVSLTIHVGAELVVGGHGVAARIEASVSVGAFGRSITLGVGFMLGDSGVLADARARTARYLSLGLGCDYPDPAAGMAMAKPAVANDATAPAPAPVAATSRPLPEASRQSGATAANIRVNKAADQSQNANPDGERTIEADAARDEPGIDFGDIPYWMLLFPVTDASANETYLVQFIPRDPDKPADTRMSGCFFAAPSAQQAGQPEYAITVSGLAPGTTSAFPGLQLSPDRPPVASATLLTKWDQRVGQASRDDRGINAPTLEDLFVHSMFMGETETYEHSDAPALFHGKEEPLPTDEKARNDVLAAAARSRAVLGGKLVRLLAVEEARSSFVSMVGQCAAQYASRVRLDADGRMAALPDVRDLDFDPTALGLTFLVTKEDIDRLLPDSVTVTVSTRRPMKAGAPAGTTPRSEGRALALNPPDRMFRENAPRLADRSWQLRPAGVQLHWDLEPRWDADVVDGKMRVQNDPRYHLQCYRIERRVVAEKTTQPQPPRRFSVAQSSPLSFEACGGHNGDSGVYLRATRHTHRLQFVDDLLDLPADLRAQILPSPQGPDPKTTYAGRVQLEYLILPVDAANTSDLPVPWIITLDPPRAAEPGVTSAIARFHYFGDQLPALGAFPLADAKDFLSLQVVEPSDEPKDKDSTPTLRRAAGRNYTLRVRKEMTIAGGVFGADALSQAKGAPPPPDPDQALGVNDIDITLEFTDSDLQKHGDLAVKLQRLPQAIQGYATPDEAATPARTYVIRAVNARGANDVQALAAQLGLDRVGGGVAARMFIRPERQNESTPSLPWTPVQLRLQVQRPTTGVSVDVTVERFEHPRALRFGALERPRVVGSGRMALVLPDCDATIDNFQPQMVTDPAGRSGVQLAWDARSSSLASLDATAAPADLVQPEDLQSLVGGFDVFALDVASVPADVDASAPVKDEPSAPLPTLAGETKDGQAKDKQSLLSYAERVCRVQRLAANEAGQSPAETGNLAQVEARYPSESRRLDPVRGKKPQAQWFSAAESFLQWPRHIERLSLCTQPEDVEIERLFEYGKPTVISFAGPDDDLSRIREAFDRELFNQLPTNPFQVVLSPQPIFTRDDGAAFSVDAARRLVLAMSLIHGVDYAPKTFTLEGTRPHPTVAGETIVTGSATLRRTPRSKRHALLADVLDLIEYENLAPSEKPVCRAYETLIEAAPPVHATTLAAFFDETASDHDPSGWGVLRSLGFACSWRLYDVDAAAFVKGDDVRAHLSDVLHIVLPRYRKAADSLGTPFVDLMGTADVLSKVVGFDGGNGSISGKAVRHGVLGLIQLELRPTVLQLAPSHSPTALPVRYGRLYRLPPPADQLLVPLKNAPTIDPKYIAVDFPDDVLLGIELITPGITNRAEEVFLHKPPSEHPSGAYAAVITKCAEFNGPFVGDRENQFVKNVSLHDDMRRPPMAAQAVAWVRLICLTPGLQSEKVFHQVLDDGSSLVFFEDELPAVLPRLHSSPAAVPHETASEAESASAWGRFGPLPAPWVAGLSFSDGAQTGGNVFDAVCEALNRMASAPPPAASPDAAATQAAAAPPLFAKPISDADRTRLASRLGAWSQRFIDKGPSAGVQLFDDDGMTPKATRLALATLTRPDPWRVAADAEGRMSVLLFEKDRYGKVRKYAVRPFGRFERLQIAMVSSPDGTKERSPDDRAAWLALTRPGLLVANKFGDATTNRNFLVTHFADAVIERSEPLSPPVILGMRAQSPGVPGSVDPRSFIEIVLSRHPQEMLSAANTIVDAGIGMRHIGVGFWRRFRDSIWLRRIEQVLQLPQGFREDAAFGPFTDGAPAVLPEPDELVLDEKTGNVHLEPVRADYDRHPDLFMGAHVLRMTDLPYGFQLFATAHVAAGAVVSPQSATSVDGVGIALSLPWERSPVANAGWQNRAVPKPGLKVAPVSRDAKDIEFSATWPLLRYVDGMADGARTLWFGQQDAPAFFAAPDAAVAYRLTLRATLGVDKQERDPQAEFRVDKPQAAEPGSTACATTLPPATPLYPVHVVGKRLVFGGPLQVEAVNGAYFKATCSMRYAGDAPRLPPPVFEGLPDDAAVNAAPLSIPAGSWSAWGAIAPKTRRTLTITPPAGTPPDWNGFQAEIVALITAVGAYYDAALPAQVRDVAKGQIDKLQPYATATAATWPASPGHPAPFNLDVAWLWGWSIALPPHVSLAPASPSWAWPDGSSPDDALKAAADIAGRTAIAAQLAAIAADTADAIVAALQRWSIARRVADEEQPVAGLRARSFDLAAPIAASVAAQAMVEVTQMIAVPADDGRKPETVDAAIAAFEPLQGNAQALAVLLRLRATPTGAAVIPMRLIDGDTTWRAAFATLGVTDLAPTASRCTLRAPIDRAASALFTAGTTKPAGPAADAWPLSTALFAASQDMLFGTARKLTLEAFVADRKATSTVIEEPA